MSWYSGEGDGMIRILKKSALLLAVVVVALVAVGSVTAASGKSGATVKSAPTTWGPDSVIFRHNSQVLGVMAMHPNTGLDVSWATPKCYKGLESPPTVITLSGATVPGNASPLITPCVGEPYKCTTCFNDFYSYVTIAGFTEMYYTRFKPNNYTSAGQVPNP